MRKNRIMRITGLMHVILLFLIPVQLLSQSVSDNGIQQQLTLQAIHHNTIDGLLLKNPAEANTVRFIYNISRQTIKRKTFFNAAYERGKFKDNSSLMTQYSFSFILSDGLNIIPKSKNFSAYLGYSLNSNPSFGTSENIYSWNSSSLLSFYQLYEYKINKQAISFSIDIPVAGAIYRPKQVYASGDKNFNKVVSTFYSNPSFASLHNFEAVDLSLMYKVNISRHFTVVAEYSFGYKKWTGTSAFTDKSHGAGLSLIYKLFK